ncbi:MAG: response regulator [Leptospirales bacterium]|nr:response regulator [Leptospirales bacterium]
MSEARPRVLIVDSDDETVARFEQLLAITGYEVFFHRQRSGLVEAMLRIQPTLIIVAEIVEDAKGLDLLDEVRSHPNLEEAPALLLADHPDEEMVITSLARGVVDIIRKPFSMAELLLRIGSTVKRERQRVELEEAKNRLLGERKLLLQYFSDDVVSKIVSGDLANVAGESLIASILFIDIRNFTSISENLDPRHVADLLSILFTDIMDLIFSNHGSVNKLIGDALLATFGCPFGSPQDAENAVRAALAVRGMTKLFNQAKPPYLKEDIRIGMGITTGRVFAGNVGSYRRMEYTVIGDLVNTASRLQSLTKKANVDLLLDRSTYDKVSEIFPLKKFRTQTLRGKAREVEIFTVMDVEGLPADDITFF